MGERLEARAELRRGAPYPLGHRSHPAVLARQQGEDAIGLAQLVGAQDDRLVAVQGHPPIVPCRSGNRGSRGRSSSARRRARAPALERELGGQLVESIRPHAPLEDAPSLHERRPRHLVGQHGGVRGRMDRVGRVAHDHRRRLDRRPLAR